MVYAKYIIVDIAVHTHTYTHTYIHTHIHTHIFIYIYTHIHTHTPYCRSSKNEKVSNPVRRAPMYSGNPKRMLKAIAEPMTVCVKVVV
jgi:hypothetical protein